MQRATGDIDEFNVVSKTLLHYIADAKKPAFSRSRLTITITTICPAYLRSGSCDDAEEMKGGSIDCLPPDGTEELMNTVEQLEKTLELVRAIGYEVHFDWFGGTGGGACQLGSRKCLFLDLAMNSDEHLAMAQELIAEISPGTKAA